MTANRIQPQDLIVAPYDAAEFLDSPAAIAAYIEAALEENDPDYFMTALATVVRAHGVAAIARKAGVGRESLYKSLAADASPRFDTVVKLLQALGLQLVAVPSPTPLPKKRVARAAKTEKPARPADKATTPRTTATKRANRPVST